jgi:hypothetical protein
MVIMETTCLELDSMAALTVHGRSFAMDECDFGSPPINYSVGCGRHLGQDHQTNATGS